MSKLLQEINDERIVDLRDPDYLPGAVEREGKAILRAVAELI